MYFSVWDINVIERHTTVLLWKLQFCSQQVWVAHLHWKPNAELSKTGHIFGCCYCAHAHETVCIKITKTECARLFSLAWICGIRLKHVKCCWNPREFDTLVIPKFRQWVWMFGKQISQNVNIRDSSFLCLWPWSVLFTGICHHELVDVYWLIIIIYLSWSWAHCWPVRFHETCQ